MSDIKGLAEKLRGLKEEKNAVILAHNYQLPEVQDNADILGDSLQLAVDASKTDSEVIVFCGVDFMAETAKILAPERTVLHPDPEAKCPMAAMCEVEFLQAKREEHPDAIVVSYVNTTADVKARTDICCTSANAVKVVRSVAEKEVIFTPDRNLGLYVQRFVPDKEIILWPGFCATHHSRITVEDLQALKDRHPEAEVMVHPECTPEVIDFADHVFSTGGMVRHARESARTEFIVGTEKEMAYRLSVDFPNKTFHPLEKAVCPNMKRITLEKVVRSLESLSPAIELSREIIERARRPLERMVDIGRDE
ncbi:MAG: quinolinate synthetase [Candidatus Proteinoplasmatales archaeon SG8-5]|nr:MAG: quinolinate synthetase [Candidatus Proteinoplasmatales archaeon SG8-5]